MTRLALLSDIHGNLPALEAVIADMEQFAPDHVIVAGDLINSVPFDAEVMARVVNSRWSVVRGNHEFYVLNYGTEREVPDMRHSSSPAWLNTVLKDWIPYLAAMPDALTLLYRDGPPIYVTHGLPGDPFGAIARNTPDETVGRWLADIEQTTYVSGHYHLSVERQVRRWHIVNPGPVGAVMDGTHAACYVLLDAYGDRWQATFRRVPYDFSRVESAFVQHRFMETLGIEGLLKCEQIYRARPTINSFANWLNRQHPGARWSYELAYEFLSLSLEAVWDTLGSGYLVNPEIPLTVPLFRRYTM